MSIDDRLRSALDNFVDSYDYASDTGSSYSYEPAISELKKVIAEELPAEEEHPKGSNGCDYWHYIYISEGKAERMCNCGASSWNAYRTELLSKLGVKDEKTIL